MNSNKRTVKIVHVYHSIYPNDKVGELLERWAEEIVERYAGHTWEYLLGQDKPYENNASYIQLQYPIQYISLSIKI